MLLSGLNKLGALSAGFGPQLLTFINQVVFLVVFLSELINHVLVDDLEETSVDLFGKLLGVLNILINGIALILNLFVFGYKLIEGGLRLDRLSCAIFYKLIVFIELRNESIYGLNDAPLGFVKGHLILRRLSAVDR